MKNKVIVILLCLMLAASGYIVHSESLSRSSAVEKQRKLENALRTIPNWPTAQNHPLLDVIVEELQLDDYIHRTYINGDDAVRLYIGYYYSSKKVGAAHDPMVCFPGQGWTVGDRSQAADTEILGPGNQLHYSTMTVEMGESKEYLVYWFQAYDEMASSTFGQKIKLAGKKLMGKGEDNAFVRISTSCHNKENEKCEELIFDFIEDFYPIFYDFVTAETP